MELQQQQKQTQQLIMSANMQQAIHILQLPIQELDTFVEEQIALNPLLEISDMECANDEHLEEYDQSKEEREICEQELSISDSDLNILMHLDEDWRAHFDTDETIALRQPSKQDDEFKNYLEQSIVHQLSLQTWLNQQAHESFHDINQLQAAEIIIGYIDEFGFLNTPLDEICILHNLDRTQIDALITEIQTFEPSGIAAATIRESLLIQLRCLHKEHTLAYRIVRDHYEQLIHNQIQLIQKTIGCSYDVIQNAISLDIAKLNIHPGASFSTHASQYIMPDAILRQEADKLIVEVNKDSVRTLHLNHQYLQLLNDEQTPLHTKQYIRQHFFSARWLARNIQQRHSSLERVVQAIAEKQKDFFIDPEGQLYPLTMTILAEELNLHESTIARIVANKYIDSPRGILPLKAFFTNKYITDNGATLSSETIKQAIVELIKQENKTTPLSDHKISTCLAELGIACARRTVTKYRLALHIGTVQQRKQFGLNHVSKKL